jgi:DNA-binding response OmpR family regulator
MTSVSSSPIVLAFAPNLSLGLSTELSGLQQMSVHWIYDIGEMIHEVGRINPASMIVAGDGDNIATFRACYALRQACPAPLHLISSTMSESEENLALSLGVTTVNTPSSAPAVIARFAKQTVSMAEPNPSEQSRILGVGRMQIDLGRRKMQIDSRQVALTRTEFDLLTNLVKAAGSVVSRADLVTKVWGSNWFGVENVLDTHLAHLRKKLAVGGFDRAIVNVRGVGFYFEPSAVQVK